MDHPDVLIVGAGPTGLLLAAELARHGVVPRIVDEKAGRSDKSKALAVHARTLEIFADLGIADEAIAAGLELHGVNMYAGDERIVHVSMDELDSPYPFVLSLPQSETERILGAHLARLGVGVEWQVGLRELRQRSGCVLAVLEHPGGEREELEVPWLAGCDGAHSTARKALGLEYEGPDIDAPFVFADLSVEWSHPHDEAHIFYSPDGLLAFLPLPGAGLWRIIADLPPGTDFPELDLALFERLAGERSRVSMGLSNATWFSSFRIRQRKVTRYRDGRVFVAGDAAHCHSPVGGQGMNTGLQDAYNLAWKLALVIRGRGRSELLDSYQAEREPIARALLLGTEGATRVVTLRHPISREIRNRLAGFLTSLEVVQQRLTQRVAQLDLGYRKSAIVAEDRGSLLAASLIADRKSEEPSLLDWFELGAAPHAGDRAPDAPIAGTTLHRMISGTQHHLLLFDGAAATEAGYARLSAIARRVDARYGEFIRPHVIVPASERPRALEWSGSVLLDGEAELHRRYGAGAECLYLIRPDGYVGYRAQPVESAELFAYLERIFV